MPNGVEMLLELARITAASDAVKHAAVRAYAMGNGASFADILPKLQEVAAAIGALNKAHEAVPPNCPAGTVPVDGMCV